MNIIIIIFLGLLFAFGLAWHDQPGRELKAASPSSPDEFSIRLRSSKFPGD